MGTTYDSTESMGSDAAAEDVFEPRPPSGRRLRIAINLLTDDPESPSGAHWFWTRVIPEMASRLGPEEELHLVVSPKSKPLHQGYGPQVRYITFPWSNEKRNLRTLSEHLYAPLRLPLSGIDVFNTLMAPLVNPSWSLVVHMKTMHAFTTPEALSPSARLYRQLSYPRSARLAEAIVINSETLRSDIKRYLEVDPAKLRLVPEAVDHQLFKPGDAGAARAHVAERYGVPKPFVLFVSSLWPYKNCTGLLRAWALASKDLPGHQLAIVGGGRDDKHIAELHALAEELGVTGSTVFVGPVPLDETVPFYRAADTLVYPSVSETFGLPILEAMACGCPVVTSNVSAMPETAGGAALLCDPNDPAALARSITDAVGAQRDGLRASGLRRAAQFTWASTAAKTLDVYREVGEKRKARSK
jgi:glycosyltransferase involved in cell wall biosynthesis